MKAENTVLDAIRIYNITGVDVVDVGQWRRIRPILEAQAEISFKAGEQVGVVKGVMLRVGDMSLLSKDELAELNVKAEAYLRTIKQAGISEVIQPGYRKLPKDKPPLLSDKEIGQIIDELYTPIVIAQAAAEAQREADIKHYEDKV